MNKLWLFFFFSLFQLNGTSQASYSEVIDSLLLTLSKFPSNTYFSIAQSDGYTVNHLGFHVLDGKVTKVEIADSLFEIGSITKVFTSTILANEIVMNNLNPLKDVNNNFDFKFHNKIKINYLSLSNHTSGLYRLPSNFYVGNKELSKPYEYYSTSLFDSYLANELDIGEINTYNYSNTGAALLAYALEKKNKTDFDLLLKKQIFDKYNMTSSSFEKTPSFAGYNEAGEVQELWKFNSFKGAGGIVSSASDLIKFVNAHLTSNDLVLAKTRESTFNVSDKMSMGLAWHILNKENDQQIYWHNGGTAGFTSSMMFDLAQKKGVVILTNISAMSSKSKIVDQYCFKLLNATP